KDDPLGELVAGEMFTAPGHQFLYRRFRALLQGNEGTGSFAPLDVGRCDYRRLQHLRMAIEYLLDLEGGDVLAAGDDDVFRAVLDLDIAIGMDHAQVAGSEPAAGQGLLRGCRVLQVALHDGVAPEHQL